MIQAHAEHGTTNPAFLLPSAGRYRTRIVYGMCTDRDDGREPRYSARTPV